MSAAIRQKRVYEPPAAEDGLRVLVTRFWPRGVRRAAVDLWLRVLGTPPEMLKSYQAGRLTYADFARDYRAWLASSPEAAPALADLVRLVTDGDITLLTSFSDLTRSHVPVLAAAVAAQALARLGDAALRRTPRFAAILFYSPQVAAFAGGGEHPDDLLAIAAGIAATGRGVAIVGTEEAEDRSPQCYLELYSVLGFPAGPVGAVVAESGQIGRFAPAEVEAIRDVAERAARILA